MFSYQSAKKFLASLALTATAATVTTFTHYECKSVQISENVTSTEHSLSLGDKSANACVTLNPLC